MECYRRAMIGEQTFEGHRENLTQANNLSRTYAVLLDALNRHRGKGQQKWRVHTPPPWLRSANKEREPVPIAGDAERPMSDARRDIAGRSEG
jgi:hypothetical protein